jgi:hypothetical protein
MIIEQRINITELYNNNSINYKALKIERFVVQYIQLKKNGTKNLMGI